MAKSPKIYTIEVTRIRLSGPSTTTKYNGTVDELKEKFRYTLDCGASYNFERGCKKVNPDPKSIKSLVANLNNAAENCCTHYQDRYYSLVED